MSTHDANQTAAESERDQGLAGLGGVAFSLVNGLNAVGHFDNSFVVGWAFESTTTDGLAAVPYDDRITKRPGITFRCGFKPCKPFRRDLRAFGWRKGLDLRDHLVAR